MSEADLIARAINVVASTAKIRRTKNTLVKSDDNQRVLYEAVGKAHEHASEEDLARVYAGRARLADQQSRAIGNSKKQTDRSERHRL
ncbi:hypothetical protein [Mesorhizobium sp.]|uniref:hypothetical protein n=1 Tax=Mesorhizobium sp. TaxID=1871066 RepID=UPI00268CD132